MSGLVDLRVGDRRLTLVSALAVFSFSAAYALLEAARDAIFLRAMPAARLPFAYLAIAALALLLTAPRRGRRDARGRLATGLAGAAAITVGFGFVVDRPLVPIALYVWLGLVATAALSRLWLLLGEMFTPGQAKRLYSLIGAGGLLGATAGAGAAALLSRVVPARGLLLLGAAGLAATALVVAFLLPAPLPDEPAARPRALGGAPVMHTPYLRRLLALALATAAAATLLDFAWKSAVAARVPAAQLPGFFATAGAAFSALSLLAQLVVAPLVVRAWGATGAAVVPPAALAALAALASTGAFLPLALARAADAGLRGTLGRTGMELLLMPLPRALRERVKPALEALGTRGGQALAAGVILGALALGVAPAHLAALAAVVAVAGVAATAPLKAQSLVLYRESLRDGHGRTSAELPAPDPAAALALVESLSSGDDEEVITAMDLLARGGRARAIPSAMLHHPSPRVARRALAVLGAAGRADFLRASAPLHGHPDAEVRALAMRLRASLGADDVDAVAALDDPSPLVQTAALVAILRRVPGSPRATRVATELAHKGPRAAKIALAQAIGDQPDDQFIPLLLALSAEPHHAVRLEVARAVRALPSRLFLPRLVEMLVDPELRRAAREAILAVGSGALDHLERALADHDTPHAVRRHLPRTISAFRSARAAAILVRRVSVEHDGAVRFKLLRGLGRLRADRPELPVDEEALQELAARVVRRALDLLAWRVALAAPPDDDDVLAALLADKERLALERLFRIVGILRPRDELELVYDGLHSRDRRRRDAAVELIAATVSPALRPAVLALIDDGLGDAERLARAGVPRPSTAAALAAMAADHSEPIAALAARRAAVPRAA